MALVKRARPHTFLLKIDFRSCVVMGLDLISKLFSVSKLRIVVSAH